MSSISYAISAVDASHETIKIALRSGAKISNEDEAREARTAKAKAMKLLNESLSSIDTTLAKYSCRAANEHRTSSPSIKSLLTQKHLPATNASTSLKLKAMATDVNPNIDSFRNTMSADKGPDPSKPTMADAVPSLQEMAAKLEPIISDFTSVLQKPYLNQFNATLNTVPVVGIKDQTLMYIGTKPGSTLLSPPTDSWSVFGNLPDGVTVTSSDNIHFFPYNADFYMSIGQKVWMKKHRQGAQPGSEPDPVLKQAVDNWPKLYEDTWQHVGDMVLPADDVRSVVPFTTLSAARDAIGFHLAILTGAGILQFLDADVLQGSNNVWSDLKYVPTDSAKVQPAWTSVAYWNNQFVGLDDAQNFWNMTPDWSAHSYTVGDQTKLPEPITELTATEQGPVGVRADGTLWKRVLDPPKDSKDPGSYAWKSWIKQEGVTNLGVASPGVILDLSLLTSTLMSRYIETQSAVAPLMNKIRAYGTTHAYFLKNLNQAAQDYLNADSDAKSALAIKNGKSFVVHAKTWAKILRVAADNAKEPVNMMTGQLTNIEAQLVTTLSILKDKLTGLQASLKAEDKYLSQLQSAFWGSIGALLISVVVALIGVATMNPWVIVGAGLLFVAGLTCAVVFGSKIGQAAADVASTKAQIDTTQTAITQLTDVVTNFQTISDLYGVLNTFFGRMSDDAGALADMDDATAEQLGSDVLADTSSIDAAATMTDEMVAACTTYLDTLSKQGIHLPSDGLVNALMTTTSITHAPAVQLNLEAHALNGSFHQTLLQAHKSLINGDVPTYLETLSQVSVINDKAIAAHRLSATATGRWFDTAALSNSGSIWSGFSKNIETQAMSLSVDTQTISQSSTIDGGLDQVRPLVVGLVQETLDLAEIVQDWAAKYPVAPSAVDAGAQEYQDRAVNACQAAQNKAKDANNSFNDFNTRAQNFFDSCEAQISKANNDIQSTKAGAATAIAHLEPPIWLNLDPFGMAREAWIRNHTDDINSQMKTTVDNLNAAITNLGQLESSGKSFKGSTLDWRTMVETVSANLFDIFGMLTGVGGQLMEDPNLYKQLMSFEWAQLANDAKTVLTILGVHSPEGSLVSLMDVNKTSDSHMAKFASCKLVSTTGFTDNAKFVSALSSNSILGTNLSSQAAQCKDAFAQLSYLLEMPAMADIVGYWDNSKSEKATLKEVTQNLKTEYVNVISMQYESVEKLYSLSILQGFRAKNARDGRLPIKIFVNNTLDSLRAALKSSQGANTAFQTNNAEFQKVVTLIQNNIDEIEKRIAALDSQIDTADKQLRDKIINEIADVVAIAFSTGALLISFGVIGPGTAAVMGLGARLAGSAAVIASSTKLVLDSLSIDDLIKFIAGLKTTRAKLQESVDDLKKVQPFFKDIVKGVGAITGTVEDMATSVQQVYDDLTLWQVIALTDNDVSAIEKSWDELRDDCLIWMDMVHAQNINPMTASQFR